jgi:hypothetical protein
VEASAAREAPKWPEAQPGKKPFQPTPLPRRSHIYALTVGALCYVSDRSRLSETSRKVVILTVTLDDLVPPDKSLSGVGAAPLTCDCCHSPSNGSANPQGGAKQLCRRGYKVPWESRQVVKVVQFDNTAAARNQLSSAVSLFITLGYAMGEIARRTC